MRSSRRFLFAASALVLLGLLVWALHRRASLAREPSYGGYPLRYWLHAYDVFDTNRPSFFYEAKAAVDQIGTNAIPTLLQLLRTPERPEDAPLKAKFLTWASRHPFVGVNYGKPSDFYSEAYNGFWVLGPRASNAVPDLMAILNQNISPGSAGVAAGALGLIGPGAKAAVPSLMRATTNSDYTVRIYAVRALGQILADPDSVVPLLIQVLRKDSAMVTPFAAGALGNYGSDARTAVPELVAILKSTNIDSYSSIPPPAGSGWNVRSQIEKALKLIDPETYAQVVTNSMTGSLGAGKR